MIAGDAWEPPQPLPEALDWFDDLGECPPLPEWLRFRYHERRKRWTIAWCDEDGRKHGTPLPDTFTVK